MNSYICTWNNSIKNLDQIYEMFFAWIAETCVSINQAEVETYEFINDCIKRGELKRIGKQ